MAQLINNWCLKVMDTGLKAMSFCVQQSLTVTLQTKVACAAKVFITSQANHFLLFINWKSASKHGHLLGSSNLKPKSRNIHKPPPSLQRETFPHFPCVQTNLHLRLGLHIIKNGERGQPFIPNGHCKWTRLMQCKGKLWLFYHQNIAKYCYNIANILKCKCSFIL